MGGKGRELFESMPLGLNRQLNKPLETNNGRLVSL